MIYKISGSWGNHEGSMLLWACYLALYGAAAACLPTSWLAARRVRVLAVQGGLTAALLAYVLFTSDPFAEISPAPAQGQGLNALLQDIGLAIHPPLLYLGYAGFSIVFALAIAGLLERDIGEGWARQVQPWALLAWGWLGCGIGLGSWWAYRELGWGGWWFWDPVENISLLPWLAATSLLHSLLAVEKGRGLAGWAVLMAILTFTLGLLGTFLVRSGLLTSVHAFANDPTRGLVMLTLVTVITGSALLLYARTPLPSTRLAAPLAARETLIAVQNLLWFTLLLTVLLGTSYPLVLGAFGQPGIAVGAPYYNAVATPIALTVALLAASAPLARWGTPFPRAFTRPLLYAAIFSITASLIFACTIQPHVHTQRLGAGLALTCATVLALAVGIKLYKEGCGLRNLAMAVSHVGFALLIAGVTIISLFEQEIDAVLQPGQEITVNAGASGRQYILRYLEKGGEIGDNYLGISASFALRMDAVALATLAPEIRIYPAERQQTIESAIYGDWLEDVYLVLGAVSKGPEAAVRVYYRPGIRWIWVGIAAIAAGGLLAAYIRATQGER